MLSKDSIISRLNKLTDEGKELLKIIPPAAKIAPEYQDSALIFKYRKWRLSCLNFIRNSFGEKHYFFKQFNDASGYLKSTTVLAERHKVSLGLAYCLEYVAESLAVLISITESVNSGMISDVKHLYESNLFSNLVEQGLELLRNGYRVAAAIYSRISIENAIRGLCDLNNIQQRNVSDMLVELRKIQIIDLPLERTIQAKYDIGTMAAHGRQDFDKYSDKDIQEMLEFVRDKILIIGT
jgi:hypothetical protein